MTSQSDRERRARPVLNPDLPEQVAAELRRYTGRGDWYQPSRLKVLLLQTALFAAVVTALAALAWLVTGSSELLSALHGPAGAVAAGSGATSLMFGGLWGLTEYGDVRFHRRLDEAARRCVWPTDLESDAAALLARVQQAKHAVLSSAVHDQDLIDRRRDLVALPEQEWQIASQLAEYSRLARGHQDAPAGERAAGLLGEHRVALQRSREAITRRVQELETYAARVADAQRHYEELQQIQRLAGVQDDVLLLLACTGASDVAVTELQGMSGEATALSHALSDALDSARHAAQVALPAAPAGPLASPLHPRSADGR